MAKKPNFTREEQCEMYARQLERAKRTKDALPYLLLSRGPTQKPCPVHAKNEALVLPIDDDYWVKFPMREHPECKCGVHGVTKREYERMKVEGVQDPDAPPLLDENGCRTGHRERRLMPIKTKPIK